MRLPSLLLILFLLGYVTTDTLVRVTTPHSAIANFSDFYNSTLSEHEVSESDGDVSHGDEAHSSENVEDNVKPHSDEAADNNSDVSDEQNDVDLEPVQKVPDAIITSHINQTFGNKKTFSCPRVKTDLRTGRTVGDLSPEDISFIASMGDGVASGIGLFDKKMDVEFRGASFASGGDANMDGLVTIPNILREFAPSLAGVSHGMGDAELNKHQLSVSSKGATTKDLPNQARDLLNRLSTYYGSEHPETDKWIMIIIAIGTEELCHSCSTPNERAIREALTVLQSSLNKALVVLLGPTHVSYQARQMKNLLKYRCECSKEQPPGFMESLSAQWSKVFEDIQRDFDGIMGAKQSFGLLALPQLTVTSRSPDLLFHDGTPFLNRRGHTYMSKWLWNRLMTGEKYNLSSAVLSQDSYFCPSVGCPYFRTTANMRKCVTLSITDQDNDITIGEEGKMKKQPRRTVRTLYSIAVAVVVISSIVALIAGVIIYNFSKRAVRGRFDEVPETEATPDPPKGPPDHPGPLTRQNALQRQSTSRKTTTLEVPSPVYGLKKSPDRSESMQLLTEA
ncbi:hypothetical protein PFISCL1PPCAC_20625 [Pristionchus fissidentatus]|uniref:Lipase n=1 Tax=Pristionchus fissidentatus TaxID=1538716 RepID=A0AAV5WCS2_9BILA|nr:hypothetical protein PFISCL1PPCAC_20625 [Pristionchus fissidentatus]